MNNYLVIIEKTATGLSTYSPDIPGCVATGNTREEVETNMKEAIEFHIESLKEAGSPIPEPKTEYTYMQVSVK